MPLKRSGNGRPTGNRLASLCLEHNLILELLESDGGEREWGLNMDLR